MNHQPVHMLLDIPTGPTKSNFHTPPDPNPSYPCWGRTITGHGRIGGGHGLQKRKQNGREAKERKEMEKDVS